MNLSEPVRDYADQTIRATLQHPEHLRAVLEHTVPDLAANFQVDEATLLGRDFFTEDWRGREADLPFEIPYRSGNQSQKTLVVVLIEHQSQTDQFMPLRMLYFAIVYWDKCWREWAGQPAPRDKFLLPPVLPIVFYTADREWGSSRTIVDLLGPPNELHRFAPEWEPIFWNLSNETPDGLLNSENPWLQCMAVIRSRDEAFEEFRRIFLKMLEKMQALLSVDRPRGAELLQMALTWTSASRIDQERQELSEQVQQTKFEAAFTEEVKDMATKAAMTLAEIVAQETTERVTKEVTEKVTKAVSQAVTLRNKKESIKEALETRFGPLDTQITEQIDRIEDVVQLRDLFRQAVTIETLENLKFPQDPPGEGKAEDES
ncbi:MAG: Rpn family recombination-promoting nuclease/putative transposase [Gemmataceae bacterium]